MAKELTSPEFNNFINKGLVFIDFYADWCIPCKIMNPILNEMSKKFKEKITFGKINIEENLDIIQKFNIHSIPNFILFKDGKIIDQFIGSMNEEELENRLKKHIK